LRGLSAKFPQALYYTMRAFFLENRELFSMEKEKIVQPPSASSSSAPPTPSALGMQQQTTPKALNANSSKALQNNAFALSNDANITLQYFRTKTGHVVAVPLTHEQDIPGLVGASRSTPSFFGVNCNVLTLDAWMEKVAAGELQKIDLSPLQYTEDLLNFLRRSHDLLAFEMECMLEEVIVRFRPEPEEELLTAVHALLLKCYQLPSFSKNELVPKMLKDTLSRVCNKFFILQPHQKSEKHIAFVNEFKVPFESNFMLPDDLSDTQEIRTDGPSMSSEDPQSSDEKMTNKKSTSGQLTTLSSIMDRLKLWKHVLQLRVKRYGKQRYKAEKVFLEHSSRHLVELSNTNIEVPGQYLTNSEPIKELHARIQFFHSTTEALLRNGYTQRRITLGGNNGKMYSFLVQYAMTYITRCDERMMQMHLLMNQLLMRHKETKQRNIVFHIPKVIPLTPRVRLMEDSAEYMSLGEVFYILF
jgi:hypothetical protein